MARTLEQAAFWRYPGKGATLVEQQAQQKAIRCREELQETRTMMEGIIHRRLQRKAREKELSGTDRKPRGGGGGGGGGGGWQWLGAPTAQKGEGGCAAIDRG